MIQAHIFFYCIIYPSIKQVIKIFEGKFVKIESS